MEHTTSAVPRFCTFFILKAEEFESLGIGFLPVLAGVTVVVNISSQVACQCRQRTIVHVLGQVFAKVIFPVWDHGDVQVACADAYRLWVNDLDLNGLFVLRQFFHTLGLLVQGFVYIGCHFLPQ